MLSFVVWTRHWRFKDGIQELPAIRKLFHEEGFEECEFDATSEVGYSMGTDRFLGAPEAIVAGEKWFEFGAEELGCPVA